tara:strand:- start:1004 stop:1735 length:732 start_codon:yes stop_codon:yes gene_type:complete
MFRNLSSLRGFKPKSLLDIGAHHGNFTISFKKNIPSAKLFFLIEANKNCAKFLKRIPFEFEICLLSSVEEEKKFYVNPKNTNCTGNSYYIEKTRHFDKNNFEIIKSTTLDKLIHNKKLSFDLIKLDTQGSELDILKGGCEVLQNAEYVIIECSTDRESYNNGAPTETEISNFLFSKGFKNKLLLEEHLWLDRKEVSFRYGDVFQKDFLFTRKKINKSFYLKANYIFNFLKKFVLKLKNKIFFK